MSEWCDNQTKPSSDFHKLPQERIYKANPRHLELAKEEQLELDKLNGLFYKLKRRQNVQNRQLQTWLAEWDYLL